MCVECWPKNEAMENKEAGVLPIRAITLKYGGRQRKEFLFTY